MKHQTSLHTIDHEGARRMQFFIQHIEEPLTEVPFDWKQLILSEEICGACKLVSHAENPLTLQLFFCHSYAAGKDIAEANGFTYLPNAKWGQNGGILYFVESADAEKVSDVLSLFAGEE